MILRVVRWVCMVWLAAVFCAPAVAEMGFQAAGETPSTAAAFTVSPTAVRASLTNRESVKQRLVVTNTGQTVIKGFDVIGSNLEDTASGHRILLPAKSFPLGGLQPQHSANLDFELPRPNWAGSYGGTLLISADSGVPQTLNVTLQTRGPYFHWDWSLVLFIAVFAFGAGLSYLIDQWKAGGGLAGAQAFLSIKTSEKELKQVADAIAAWEKTLPAGSGIGLPRAEVRIAELLQEIATQWRQLESSTVEQLQAAAGRYSLSARGVDALWQHVQVAAFRWSATPDKLKTVVKSLDDVAAPVSDADISTYQKNLDDKLQEAASAAMREKVEPGNETPLPPSSKDWSVPSVKSRIRRMNLLYQLLVAIAAFIGAYTTNYAPHLAFGTLADYMGVFLWSLGVTTTGTQILAKAQKPAGL